MRKMLLFIALAMVAVACNGKKTNDNQQANDSITTSLNAPASLDFDGIYFGVLPCASCPGINTLIDLDDDGSYEKIVEYQESNAAPEITKGQFERKDNSTIIIEGAAYLLEKDKLFMLDAENKIVTGELAANYVLEKMNFDTDAPAKAGYTVKEYSGSDSNEYDVVFNANTDKPIALVKCNDIKVVLTQSAATDKNATYSNKNAKLIVSAQGEATFESNGKQVELKEKK